MRKLLGLFCFLAAGVAFGQAREYAVPLSDAAVEKDGGAAGSIGGALSDGDYGDITVGGSGTTMTLDSGSNPTFTLFKVGNGATGPGSFDVLEDSDNGTNYIRTIGQSSLSANRTYTLPDIGGDGTYAVSPTLYPGLPFDPTTTTVLNEDFYVRPLTAGVGTSAAAGSMFGIGAGTTSGFVNPTVNADGNHPGVVEMSSGTTNTGTYSINGGYTSNTALDTVVIHGGEIVEWTINIPILATGTDTFKVWAGFCDITTSNGDCADGLNVYSVWDSGATNNKWGCGAAKAASRTTTNATDVVTTGWHKLRIEVNSDATSVAYKVDGAAISCSPYTGANIPTGAANGTGLQLRIGASAGCTLVGTCHVAADRVYFYQPGLSR